MAEYTTGRAGTVLLSGTWEGKLRGYAGTVPLEGPPGHCIPGTGEMGQSGLFDIYLGLPWGTGGFLHAYRYDPTSGFYGVQLDLNDGFGGSDADFERHANPSPKNITFTWSGDISIEADVVEYFEPSALTVYADTYGFLDEPYGSQLDGLIAKRGRYFLKATEIRITANAGSATVTSTISGLDYELNSFGLLPFGGMPGYYVAANGDNNPGYANFNLEYTGLAPSPSLSRVYNEVDADAECTVTLADARIEARIDCTTPTVSDACDVSQANAGSCEGFWEPPRAVRITARAEDIEGNDRGPLTVGWISHASGGLETVSEFDINPEGSDDKTQITFSADCVLNGVGFADDTLDERAAARCWLDEDSIIALEDDPRDWRLPIQLDPYVGLKIVQDETTTISGAASLTSASNSITLTESNLEGYRYLEFTATPDGFADTTLTLTIGEKTYRFAVGADGSPVDIKIDLCAPTNVWTGGVDKRQSRFPLEITGGVYAPDQGQPDIDLSDEQKGWLWGILERPTSVSIATIPSSHSLDVTALTLVRDVQCQAGVMLPFKSELLGWTSETDNTYLDPDFNLYSDWKEVGPWPARAHVVPLSGDDYYYFYSLADMELWIDASPGWSATAQTAPTGKGWLGPSIEAGNMDPLIWDHVGEVWRRQIHLDPSTLTNVWVAYKVDQVDWYPGCGIPWLDYDDPDQDSHIPLFTSKLMRGLGEGLAFRTADGAPLVGKTVQAYVDGSPGDIVGTATVQTAGNYRTGTPFARGGDDIVTKLIGATPAREHLREWQNRYRTRTSFKGSIAAGANAWNLNSMLGQFHRTDIEDRDVWYRRAAFGAPFGGFEQESQITSTADCSHPRMVEDGRPVLYLGYIREDLGMYIVASSDEGTTFGDETLLIEDAKFCTIQTGPLGELVAMGFVPDDPMDPDSTGPILMRFREPGSLTWTDPVAIKDDSDADLSFEPDTFHVSPDKSGSIRWILTAKIAGETGVSEWQSVDECLTFKLVT